MGVLENEELKLIKDERGKYDTPNYVSFTKEGEVLVGSEAKEKIPSNSSTMIYNLKNILGKKYNDPSLQKEIKEFPFKLVNENNLPFFEVFFEGEKKLFSPEEIVTIIFKKLKKNAENFLGKTVNSTVLSVPSYFSDDQRQSLKNSVQKAGLYLVRIVVDPVSISFANKLNTEEIQDDIHYIIFHLGKKKLEISVLNLDYGVFEVLSHITDEEIGGTLFDENLLKYISEQKNISESLFLRKEIEKLKKKLSSEKEVLFAFHNENIGLNVTREKFEEINMHLFDKAISDIKKALKEANITIQKLDQIVLSGGSTKIPKIQEIISTFFGKKPLMKVDPKFGYFFNFFLYY